MMRLHDNRSSGNDYKARLLLAQLRVPFERVEYDSSCLNRTPSCTIWPRGRRYSRTTG